MFASILIPSDKISWLKKTTKVAFSIGKLFSDGEISTLPENEEFVLKGVNQARK
jgi:hypothetical protein